MNVKPIPFGKVKFQMKVDASNSGSYPFRCQMKVNSTGTGDYPGDNHRCSRQARYEINSLRFCKQHSGDFLLNHFLNQGEQNESQ